MNIHTHVSVGLGHWILEPPAPGSVSLCVWPLAPRSGWHVRPVRSGPGDNILMGGSSLHATGEEKRAANLLVTTAAHYYSTASSCERPCSEVAVSGHAATAARAARLGFPCVVVVACKPRRPSSLRSLEGSGRQTAARLAGSVLGSPRRLDGSAISLIRQRNLRRPPSFRWRWRTRGPMHMSAPFV